MLRGAAYGTLGVAAGIVCSGWGDPFLPFVIGPLILLCLVLVFPALLLVSIPLQVTLVPLHRIVRDRLFLPFAVLTALPYMVLLLAVAWRLFADPAFSLVAKDLLFLGWVLVGGSIGLGLGCGRDVRTEAMR